MPDAFTITIVVLLLLTVGITPLCNALFRRPRTTTPPLTDSTPSLSVVITTHDNAAEIRNNLPAILQQEYDGKFEVIVVDESSTDDSEEELKLLKAQHPQLYTTYIPNSSHYVSRKKLALTIGIKAAHSEWIVLTDIDCRPNSSKWLATIASHTSDDIDIIMGYTGYLKPTPAYWRYDRLLTACYQMRQAERSTAYRHEGHNLTIRKSKFMAQNGFLKNLKYLRGEYDFTVNEMATSGSTAVMLEPDSFVRQEYPSHKTWRYSHLYYLESRRHMKRGFCHRLLFNADQAMLHFGWLMPLVTTIYSAVTQQWILLSAAIATLIATLAVRMAIFHKACRQFEESIALWKAPLLELRMMWQNAWFMLRHLTADKYDFIRR